MKISTLTWYLKTKHILWILIINLIGTGFGFWWYKDQLSSTPYLYWLFTPDCPLYTLFFALLLISALLRANCKQISLKGDLFSSLVFIGLIKYGIWTIFVLVIALLTPGVSRQPIDLILLVGHGGMLAEGIVFLPLKKLRFLPITISLFWFILNDYFDYFKGVHPTLPVPEQVCAIKYFSFLSTIFIWLVLVFGIWFRQKKSPARP